MALKRTDDSLAHARRSCLAHYLPPVAQRDPGELDKEDGLPIATLSRDEHQS